MRKKRRKLKIAPRAVESLKEAHPSDEELVAVENVLRDLTANPMLGYPVAFTNPRFYRIDVGRLRVHYVFDDRKVEVSYMGAY